MEGSVPGQNTNQNAIESEAVLVNGNNTVAGNTASTNDMGVLANTKPITFYKKAWFWIIIAVVVLGGAGVGIFLGIRSSIIAGAIEKYRTNLEAVYSEIEKFDSAFATAYSDSGLAGYYYNGSSDAEVIGLRNKCLEIFNVRPEVYDNIFDNILMTGDDAVEKYGDSKVADLSELYGDSVDKLKDATKNISKCEDMLTDRVKEDVDIEIGTFVLEKKGTYYTWYDTELPVKVTNKSDSPKSFKIEITAYDADGEKIASDYEYARTMNSGKSEDLKFFISESDSVSEKLQGASFKVTKISQYNP